MMIGLNSRYLAVSGPSSRRLFHASARSLAKQKLVILGSGWAGYNVARKVDKSLYDVTVVSPNSYFSFTPFLASTAVGTLDFRCATEPVRGIKHVHYAQGWAKNIDWAKKTVEVEPALSPVHDVPRDTRQGTKAPEGNLEPYEIEYEKLVIAAGCYSASFGIPGVSQYAHFLKDVRDARAIRNRLLECLEQAMHPNTTPEQRKALLHIAIVGGGPTGVEFGAELHDFVEDDVYRLYPELKGQISISLYDVAPHILSSFDESLREYAEKKFARNNVEVRGGAKITAVGADWLELEGGERIPFGLLVWNTGLTANPFIASLSGVQKDEKTKSIKVDKHLSPLDESGAPIKDVFAIGDNCTPADGNRLPATAQVASQMAKHTSKTLDKLATGTSIEDLPGFVWKNMGSMVFVGDERAIVDRSSKNITGPRSRLAGITAWIVWRSYYMTLAMGWRNKLLVPMYWALAWFFGRDVTRF